MRFQLVVMRLLLGLAAICWIADARPALAYHRSSHRAGYGGGGGSTVAGSYLNGMAAYARAIGQMNLANSNAAINYQHAYGAALDNRKKAEATYFEMRRMNESYVAQYAHPKVTPEEVKRLAELGLPQRLTNAQLAADSGKIQWPAILMREEFAQTRDELEGLFALRAVGEAGVGTDAYRQIHDATARLEQQLDGMVKQLLPEEFAAGKHFIDSLAYENHFPVTTARAGMAPAQRRHSLV